MKRGSAPGKGPSTAPYRKQVVSQFAVILRLALFFAPVEYHFEGAGAQVCEQTSAPAMRERKLCNNSKRVPTQKSTLPPQKKLATCLTANKDTIMLI